MISLPSRLLSQILLLFLSFSLPTSLQAFHGLFLPSYGARQAGMGGAFLAVGGSVMDLQNNPAGLLRLKSGQFEAGIALNQATIHYNDRTFFPGENLYFENQNHFHPVSPLPYAGYAMPVSDRFAFGVAVYAQGGGGAEIDGIIRRAAAESTGEGLVGSQAFVQEELKFRFLHAKMTLGGAVAFGRLRLGVGVDLSYGTNRLDRNLSVASDPDDSTEGAAYLHASGGFHYRSDSAFAPSGKIGLSYDWNDRWTSSYAYTAVSYLPLNGMIRVDSVQPLRSGSSQTERTLPWPERHSMGLAYRSGAWTAAFDLHYIPWSRHFDRMTFRMDRPMITTPMGPVASALIWNLRWNDQTVGAIGLEYASGSLAYRIGLSYGATPIPSEGLSPFLGSTTEYHFSTGLGWTLGAATLDMALEYAPGRVIHGSPLSDWAISREVQGALFQFSRSTSTTGLYMGLRYHR